MQVRPVRQVRRDDYMNIRTVGMAIMAVVLFIVLMIVLSHTSRSGRGNKDRWTLQYKVIKDVILVSMFLTVGLLCVSCYSTGINKDKRATYHKMKKAYEDINIEVDNDMDKYGEAILFLTSDKSLIREEIEYNRYKLEEVIDDGVFNRLLSKSVSLDDEEIIEENFDRPLDDDEFSDLEIDGEYPIYGVGYEIIDYGTLEESEKSLEEVSKLPINSIKTITVYKDILISRVNNIFSGDYLLKAVLAGGKISDYEIMR